MRSNRTSLAQRAGAVFLALGFTAAASPAFAAADSTEDYPIPRRMISTDCSAEQILAAARNRTPVYYERYMADYNNKSPEVEQAARDRIHWFYSLNAADRRAYSEEIATNIYGEPLVFQWPNWSKIFFNNKGVVAKEAESCDQYARDDQSVWNW